MRGEKKYRIFIADESEKFEPFRSRHRQAIILDILKRFPKIDEEVKLYNLVFKITKMDDNKSQILELEVSKK